MAISYVSSAFAEATSISSMPSHQAGDLLIMVAYRIADNSIPTVPAGWIAIRSVGGSSNAIVVAYKVATGSSETSGTWTSAAMVGIGVWRDSSNYIFPVISVSGSGNSTSVSYNTLSPLPTSGTQWVAAFVGGSLNSTATETAPTGLTNRGSLAGASTGEIAIHDSNSNLTAWTAQTVTVTSEKWATMLVEIRDTGIAKSAGTSGYGSRARSVNMGA